MVLSLFLCSCVCERSKSAYSLVCESCSVSSLISSRKRKLDTAPTILPSTKIGERFAIKRLWLRKISMSWSSCPVSNTVYKSLSRSVSVNGLLSAASRSMPRIWHALRLIERNTPCASTLSTPSLMVLIVTSNSPYKRPISSGSKPMIARWNLRDA